MKLKKLTGLILTAAFSGMLLVGCASNNTTKTDTKVSQNQQKTTNKKEMLVYCGAALKDGMKEIGKKFEEKNGVKVNFNFASCAQNLSQIELSKKGDIYIPGSFKYYKIIKGKKLAGPKIDIAHHIPVIAVKKNNPKNIKELKDLGKKDVKVIMGNKNTAIGKVSEKVLEQNKLKEKVMKNVAVTTGTVNEIIVDLTMNQGDAGIVWEENVLNNKDLKEVIIDKKINKVQTIPGCILNSSKDKEASNKFLKFIVSDEGKSILKKHGFKTMDEEI